MHYLDLDYSKQQYLIVLYSSIIDEIDKGASHGQIVRHLIKDGSDLAAAEELFQYIFNNKTIVNELVAKMQANTKKIKTEYEMNLSKQLVRSSYNPQEQLAAMKEFEHLAVHAGVHLLGHLIKAFF